MNMEIEEIKIDSTTVKFFDGYIEEDRRINIFDEILLGYFKKSVREKCDDIDRDIIGAIELEQRLKERLEAQSGKTVTLQCSVDASLLGGVRVDFDGRVFDGSLRRRMDEIKKVLDQ